MNFKNFKGLPLVVGASVGLMACNPLNKIEKYQDSIDYSVTPNPIEMHGDSVDVAVKGKIEPKLIHPKVVLTVKPVFMGDDSVVVQEWKPVVLAGEKMDVANAQVTQFDQETKVSLGGQVPYKSAMESGNLYVQITGEYKGKTKEFIAYKIAPGTNITPYLVQSTDQPTLGVDKFQRVIPQTYNADIHYQINSSYVRSSELKDADMVALSEAMKAIASDTSLIYKGVSIEAYASPDGEISFNDKLADQRAASAGKAVSSAMRKAKVEGYDNKELMNLVGKGEDWDGFKSLMEASDIADKQLIIRVLSMYDEPMKREQEIKNLAETYLEVKDQILPELRRSQISVTADKVGRTDAQIQEAVANNDSTLTVEEILYAATLTNDLNEKLSIYKKATEAYPEDWRGYNNMGYVLLLQNKVSDASSNFDKAASIESNDVVNNNLGIIARLNGDKKGAQELFAKSSSAESKHNMGTVQIQLGDYAGAVSSFGSEKSFNAALAQMLNGDNATALKTLEASEAANTAEGYYLKAIIAMRDNNKEMAQKNLDTAIEKDPTLKAKSMKDVEFLKLK